MSATQQSVGLGRDGNSDRAVWVVTWRLGVLWRLELCKVAPGQTLVGGYGRAGQVTLEEDKRHQQEKWWARSLVQGEQARVCHSACVSAIVLRQDNQAPVLTDVNNKLKVAHLSACASELMLKRLGKRSHFLLCKYFYYISNVSGSFIVSSHCHFRKSLPKCESRWARPTTWDRSQTPGFRVEEDLKVNWGQPSSVWYLGTLNHREINLIRSKSPGLEGR